MKLENTLTKEQQSIYNHNKFLAWKHFYPDGNGVAKKGYVLHHIDDSLRHTDVERYIQWNVDDLVMITKNEHSSLHAKGKPTWAKGKHFSESHKAKISASLTGKKRGTSWNSGKHDIYSEETKRKISESTSIAFKGMLFWNNGIINVRAKECPEGFVKGKIKTNK